VGAALRGEGGEVSGKCGNRLCSLAAVQNPHPPLSNHNHSLAYDAEEHGWDFRAFHERVDGKGAAIVVARSEAGATFGGYNPEGWIGLGEDRASNGAFLFTWLNGDTGKPPVKLPKVRFD